MDVASINTIRIHILRGPWVMARVTALGRAVQVDPIKPTLKAPGTKRLKLKCDEPLSICFQFQLAPPHLGDWSTVALMLGLVSKRKPNYYWENIDLVRDALLQLVNAFWFREVPLSRCPKAL